MRKIRMRANGKSFTVRAEVSSVRAKNGKIVIVAKNYHHSIPAVLFTPEKAEVLVDIIEGSYSTSNK